MPDAPVRDETLVALTADIVAAHVGNTAIDIADVPVLIETVHRALAGLGCEAPASQRREPAVSVRASVKHDHIVCLEDGRKLKMLKRYLRTQYDLTPDQYRRKWGLPADYPMVAPAYADQRRDLAKRIGLGTRSRRA